MTYAEWCYVVFNRPNAGYLRGVAQVNGVNGLVFLPDNWTCPAGVTFKSGYHNDYIYAAGYYAAHQTFTAAEWSKLEAAGAVFLPAAGSRDGSTVRSVQGGGYYWSATERGSYFAGCHYFYSGEASMYDYNCTYGLSVRLVKDLQ